MGAKTTKPAQQTFWLVPLTTDHDMGFSAFAIFKVRGSHLVRMALLPEGDTPSGYGYGSNLDGSHLTIERPYDVPGQKCCKNDKLFEYELNPDSVVLKQIHYRPERP